MQTTSQPGRNASSLKAASASTKDLSCEGSGVVLSDEQETTYVLRIKGLYGRCEPTSLW